MYFFSNDYFHSFEIALGWNLTAAHVVVLLVPCTNPLFGRWYTVSSYATATICSCTQKAKLHYLNSDRL